ncbi:ATP-NAD kinase-like domain-containing protein [Mortierella sp. GBAus27b]|nr:hypothetical protein BGX31_004090 [Mortierella sp. GBA43]KAI8347158.1 ATP-NAD kinase-like domain-containing protein [Mortierella sp. GBAus27b]
MGILPTDAFPLLIVLNPHSGKKQGQDVLKTIVEPALIAAKKPFKVVESTAQGHAQSYFFDNIKAIIVDLVQSLSSTNDSNGGDTITRPKSATLQVMVLGGDGTVHEIVNGVLRGVEGTPFISHEFRPSVQLSIIPTGTGNAISTSLGVADAQDALNRFLAGNSVPLRLINVSTRKSPESPWKAQVYTVVVNSFGLHCATVYDSEEFRHLGNERFKQAAMKNIENLKQYEGKLEFFGPVQTYDKNSQALISNASGGNDDAGLHEATTSLAGPFTYLLITKQASLEPGFTPTPLASTSDEWMDILAVQNAGQAELLSMFGQTATGRHIEQEKVEYFKAKAVELEIPETSVKGRLCVDGEFMMIEGGPKGRVRFEIAADAYNQIFSVFA